jgi:hypothetical protein
VPETVSVESVTFDVRLVDHLGDTVESEFRLSEPEPPDSLRCEIIFDAPELSWRSIEGTRGYIVYRAENVPLVFVRQNMDPVHGMYEDRSVEPGVTYYYQVTSVDSNWNESEASDLLSVEMHGVRTGWPQDVPGAHRSSVLVCDFDPTYPGLEVIQGSHTHGLLYAFHADGTLMEGWPVYPGGEFWGSPSAGDIDGDDTLEVVASTWKSWVRPNRVFAYEYDGSDVEGWPVIHSGGSTTNEGSYESPVVGDLDGDGDVEVIQKTIMGYIYVWEGDGSAYEHADSTGKFYDLPEGSWSYGKASLGDIDGDGKAEVVVGSSHGSSGGLYAIDHEGSVKPGFPVQVGGKRVYSRIAIADFEPDSAGLEIAFIQANSGENVQHVYIVSSSGNVLPGWPVDEATGVDLLAFSNPSAGDVDSDGELELCLNNDDNVVCFEVDGSYVAGFPFDLEYGLENMGSLLVGSVYDSDNQIFFGSADERVYGLYDDLSPLPGFPIFMETFIYGTPTVTDLDLDGDAELVVSCLNGIYVYELGGSYDPLEMDWPMYEHDIGRTGCMETPLERMEVAEGRAGTVRRFALLQNAPNPFSGVTRIAFTLPERSSVCLTLYDASGRAVNRLLDVDLGAGSHRVEWDGRDGRGRRLPQGVYFYRLEAGDRTATRRMVLIR